MTGNRSLARKYPSRAWDPAVGSALTHSASNYQALPRPDLI